MSENLKPCAHCGNQNVEARQSSNNPFDESWYVQCNGLYCYMHTAYCKEKETAINIWNNRAKQENKMSWGAETEEQVKAINGENKIDITKKEWNKVQDELAQSRFIMESYAKQVQNLKTQINEMSFMIGTLRGLVIGLQRHLCANQLETLSELDKQIDRMFYKGKPENV